VELLSKPVVVFGAIAACALASGCALSPAQKTAGIKFAESAQTLGELAAAEFKNSRDDVVEMRMLLKELGDPNVDASPDGLFTIDRVTVRTQASQALAKYGRLLGQLIGSSQTERIQQASDSLVASLGGVGGVDISQVQSARLSTGIAKIAGLFVEAKRKKAVREIVPAMHEPLLQLLAAMKASFDPADVLWSGAYGSVVEDLQDVATNVPSCSSLPSPLPCFTEEGERRARALAAVKRQRFDDISTTILAALGAVEGAHADLRNVLVNDEFFLSDLDAFVAQAEELAGVYAILEDQ
jgi:hypothetical protein